MRISLSFLHFNFHNLTKLNLNFKNEFLPKNSGAARPVQCSHFGETVAGAEDIAERGVSKDLPLSPGRGTSGGNRQN